MFGKDHVSQNVHIKRVVLKTDEELIKTIALDRDKSQHFQRMKSIKIEQLNNGHFMLRTVRAVFHFSHEIVYGEYQLWFHNFIMSFCLLSAVLAGWDTYPTTAANVKIIGTLNILVLVVFCLEILLKVLADSGNVVMYFRNPVHGLWNTFDFVVTIISIPGILARNGSNFARIFRLVRVLEQFQQIPAMRAIIKGLFAGVRSIVYILLLLVLVFYVYAVVGVFTFSENNPFFFRDIPLAFTTLFRGMTLENWEQIMFIDVYGCDRYPTSVYMLPFYANFSGINVTNSTDLEWDHLPAMYRCTDPLPKPVTALAYWMSFIVIASFIVLSLFVGVITLHMQDTINEVRQEKEETARKRRLEQQLEDLKTIRLAGHVMDLITRVNEKREEREAREHHAAPVTPQVDASPSAANMTSAFSDGMRAVSQEFSNRRRSLSSSMGTSLVHFSQRFSISQKQTSSCKDSSSVPVEPSSVRQKSSMKLNVDLPSLAIISESGEVFAPPRDADAASTPNRSRTSSKGYQIKYVPASHTSSLMLSRPDVVIVDPVAAEESPGEDVTETQAKEGVARKQKIELASSAQLRKVSEMTGLLIEAWYGETQAKEHHDSVMRSMSTHARRFYRLKLIALQIMDHSLFHASVVSLILCSSILVGLELDLATPDTLFLFNTLELLIVILFCVELSIRFVADEFDTIHFLKNGYNLYDLVIIIASFLPQSNVIVVIFRLLRVLRLVKLMRMFPQLGTIVQALFSGLASIRYVGAIIGFTFYFFALIGFYAFNKNDKKNFGDLETVLISLCSIVTLDNWGDIMYRNIYGCDVYPLHGEHEPLPSPPCETPHASGLIASVYFIFFIIVSTFVMLTLFIGVVTTAMEVATQERQTEADAEEKLQALIANGSLKSSALVLYKKVFEMLDTDGSGSVEITELQLGLSCVKMYPSVNELHTWIVAAGLDPDKGSYGIIEFVSFMQAMYRRSLRERFKLAGRKLFSRNRPEGGLAFLNETAAPLPESDPKSSSRLNDALKSSQKMLGSLFSRRYAQINTSPGAPPLYDRVSVEGEADDAAVVAEERSVLSTPDYMLSPALSDHLRKRFDSQSSPDGCKMDIEYHADSSSSGDDSDGEEIARAGDNRCEDKHQTSVRDSSADLDASSSSIMTCLPLAEVPAAGSFDGTLTTQSSLGSFSPEKEGRAEDATRDFLASFYTDINTEDPRVALSGKDRFSPSHSAAVPHFAPISTSVIEKAKEVRVRSRFIASAAARPATSPAMASADSPSRSRQPVDQVAQSPGQSSTRAGPPPSQAPSSPSHTPSRARPPPSQAPSSPSHTPSRARPPPSQALAGRSRR